MAISTLWPKPPRWPIQPGAVDPNQRWVWHTRPRFILPLWEHALIHFQRNDQKPVFTLRASVVPTERSSCHSSCSCLSPPSPGPAPDLCNAFLIAAKPAST
jgi:hypothetical protein